MTLHTSTRILRNVDETLALGKALAIQLRAGDSVLLDGDLGAGKTTLSRGIIMALTQAPEVPSPTYTLVQTYNATDFEIWHMDLYRLDQPDDIWELGVEDAFEDALCLIEWPDRAGGFLPDKALRVLISFQDSGRIVQFTGSSEWMKRLEHV